MSALQVGRMMRLLGWLVIAAIVLGLSLDGRTLPPVPLAMVAAVLLGRLAAVASVDAVRRWMAAAAVWAVVYAACALAPWVSSADPMGMLRLSQVVAGIGFACYCRGLAAWLTAGGWTQPARQLRWCAAFFVGVAVALGAALVAVVALIDPEGGANAPTGFDIIFSRQLPAPGSVPIVAVVAAALVTVAVTLAALAAMATMSTLNRDISRYLLGTGPAPDVIAAEDSGQPAEE